LPVDVQPDTTVQAAPYPKTSLVLIRIPSSVINREEFTRLINLRG
jgi:hypothetical protein